MDAPHACPFCLASDLRRLAATGAALIAYRCSTCQRVFYTAADARVQAYYGEMEQARNSPKRPRKSSIH